MECRPKPALHFLLNPADRFSIQRKRLLQRQNALKTLLFGYLNTNNSTRRRYLKRIKIKRFGVDLKLPAKGKRLVFPVQIAATAIGLKRTHVRFITHLNTIFCSKKLQVVVRKAGNNQFNKKGLFGVVYIGSRHRAQLHGQLVFCRFPVVSGDKIVKK